MIYQRISKMLLLGLLVLPLASCSDDNSVVNNDKLMVTLSLVRLTMFLRHQNGIQAASLEQTKA